MTVHSPEAIQAEKRRYLQVFGWLALLTALELGTVYLPIIKFVVVLILVILALTKAALVALYYMHLAVERRTLLTIAITPLILCAFLVFMLAPDHTHITRIQTRKTPDAADAGAPEHH